MRISKYLQIVLLFTFMLPFFRQCNSAKVYELENQKITDSIEIAKFIDSLMIANPNCNIDSMLMIRFRTNSAFVQNSDTITNDSIKQDTVSANNDVTDKKGYRQDTSFGNKLVDLFFTPNNSYTGIGYVVSSIYGLIYYGGATFAFLLWIIGLRLKYKRKNAFHFINIIGLILLFFSYFDFKDVNFGYKLWGYWISFGLGASMIIIDLVLFITGKYNKNVA